ncbi:MAG: rRNA maturation RNase YbeY [Patescibacteria group bacterium]|nr:rRNA maturation RNase YbeY [Patescibacteria group bacterium]
MHRIRIASASHYPVNKQKLKDVIQKRLTERLVKECEVSILICGDRQMKKLNKQYRNIDDTTDVLSFPQDDPSQKTYPFPPSPDNVLYLGDIILSYPQAIKEAADDHVLVDDKLEELALHGLDHLMGIHHD